MIISNIDLLSCCCVLQTRHQQGDTFPLTVDEILDETNQLDIGAKNRHWLSTEVSHPLDKHTVGHFN